MADSEILVKIAADIKDLKAGLDKANSSLKEFSAKAKKETKETSDVMIKNFKNFGAAASIAFGAASAALISFTKSAFDELAKTERSMIGLRSATEAMGIDFSLANQRVKELSQDGFLDASESAKGFRDLLAAGLSLDQATLLMKGFKDSAISGRKEGQDMGESVAKSIKMFASELENSKDKIQTLDETMRKNALFSGDAERASRTIEGQISKMNQAISDIKLDFAVALKPQMEELIKTILDNKQAFIEFATAAAQLMKIAVKAFTLFNDALDVTAIKLAAFFEELKLISQLLTFKIGIDEFIEASGQIEYKVEHWKDFRTEVQKTTDETNKLDIAATKTAGSLTVATVAAGEAGGTLLTVGENAKQSASGVDALSRSLDDLARRGIGVAGGISLDSAGKLAESFGIAANQKNLTRAASLGAQIAEENGFLTTTPTGDLARGLAAMQESNQFNSAAFRESFGSSGRVALLAAQRNRPSTIRRRASGGLITSPEISLIGEAGPEKVVPLNKPSLGGNGIGTTINVTIGTMTGVGLTVDELMGQFQQRLRAMISY